MNKEPKRVKSELPKDEKNNEPQEMAAWPRLFAESSSTQAIPHGLVKGEPSDYRPRPVLTIGPSEEKKANQRLRDISSGRKKSLWDEMVGFVGKYSDHNLYTPALHRRRYDAEPRGNNFTAKTDTYGKLYSNARRASSVLSRINLLREVDPLEIFTIRPLVERTHEVNFDDNFDRYLHNKARSALGKYRYQIAYPRLGANFFNMLQNERGLVAANRHEFYSFIFPVLTLMYFVSVGNERKVNFINFSAGNVFINNGLLKVLDMGHAVRGVEIGSVVEEVLLRGRVEYWMPPEVSYLAKVTRDGSETERFRRENPSVLDESFFHNPQFYASLKTFSVSGIRDSRSELIMPSLLNVNVGVKLDSEYYAFLRGALEPVLGGLLAEGEENAGVQQMRGEIVKQVSGEIGRFLDENVNRKLDAYSFGQMFYNVLLVYISSVHKIEGQFREHEAGCRSRGERVPENVKSGLVKMSSAIVLLKIILKYVIENLLDVDYKRRKTLSVAFEELVFMISYYDMNFKGQFLAFVEQYVRTRGGVLSHANLAQMGGHAEAQNRAVLSLVNFLLTNLRV